MRKILGLFLVVFFLIFAVGNRNAKAAPMGGGGGNPTVGVEEICGFGKEECVAAFAYASWCSYVDPKEDVNRCFPKFALNNVNCVIGQRSNEVIQRINTVCTNGGEVLRDDGRTMGQCFGTCYGDGTGKYYRLGHVCQTNESNPKNRTWIQCTQQSDGFADWSKYSLPTNTSTPTPAPKLEYGAEAQCGSCKSGDFVGVDSATVDYCTKNPSACAPLGKKCSKAGFCGNYQFTCPWTDNRPNCIGDGTYCGPDSNKCGGKQGMKCCPGLTVLPNGVCGCSGSVPTPTTAPAPACMSITRDIATPVLGSSVRYTCGVSKNATRYEFQYRLLEPGQDARNARFVPLATVSNGSNISAPLVMNRYGKYTVQCRVCNSAGCAPFEGGY